MINVSEKEIMKALERHQDSVMQHEWVWCCSDSLDGNLGNCVRIGVPVGTPEELKDQLCEQFGEVPVVIDEGPPPQAQAQ